MAQGDIGPILGNLEFDTEDALTPFMLHVAGHVFAIAYKGVDFDGWLKTVTISDDGETLALTGQSLEFDAADITDIAFIHVAGNGNVFAIVYKNSTNDLILKTVTISDDGLTLALTGASLEVEGEYGYQPDIIHVDGLIYAIVYAGTGNFVRTVSISDDGLTLSNVAGSFEYDAAGGLKPKIIHVSGNVFAVAHSGGADDGWITTISITPGGAIGDPVLGSLEFDVGLGMEPDIIRVAGNVFAVVYRGADDDGWLKTVTISDDGETLALTGQSLEFDEVNAVAPRIIHISGHVFAIAYQGELNDGWLKIVTISDDGLTLALTGQSLEFNIESATTPKILLVTGDIHAIVYSDTDSDGRITTMSIEKAAASRVKHSMMMGVG